MNDATRLSLHPKEQSTSDEIAPLKAGVTLGSYQPSPAERAIDRLYLDLMIATVVAVTVALFLWQMSAATFVMALAYGGTAWASTLKILVGIRIALSTRK